MEDLPTPFVGSLVGSPLRSTLQEGLFRWAIESEVLWLFASYSKHREDRIPRSLSGLRENLAHCAKGFFYDSEEKAVSVRQESDYYK